jgi:hypothetical protein
MPKHVHTYVFLHVSAHTRIHTYANQHTYMQDFYVFRNKSNNKVQVVYNRNSGGIGLIEPE